MDLGIYVDMSIYMSVCTSICNPTMRFHAWPCHHAMPCHAMPCHAMPCHAMPCHAMPCHAMPCHGMLDRPHLLLEQEGWRRLVGR